MLDGMLKHISGVYVRRDWPALGAQLESWRSERPFAGKKLLDATPVFTNTLAKYLPLIAGGAELTVGIGDLTPFDPAVPPLLRKWGIPVVSPAECGDPDFDVVMDCAGVFADVPARCGRVELTRSGLYRYRDYRQPVFFADAGRIKLIETTLGTGEGCVRAMNKLGYDLSGRTLLVFGGGKVGGGIALYARRAGARVTVADFPGAGRKFPEDVRLVDTRDVATVAKAVAEADFIVSATGIAGALAEHAEALCASSAVIANMGILDEFGDGVPAERVLNGKRSLNFILAEPTHLRFIDPTLALDNAGALEVLRGHVADGVAAPPAELEMEILATVRRDGAIAKELDWLEEK